MKETSQLDSTLSDVKKRFNPEHDVCTDKITDIKRYSLEGVSFKYEHGRPLPEEIDRKAHEYIRALVKRYPFQLRYILAVPLYRRFSEAWCDTGDEGKSLRAI